MSVTRPVVIQDISDALGTLTVVGKLEAGLVQAFTDHKLPASEVTKVDRVYNARYIGTLPTELQMKVEVFTNIWAGLSAFNPTSTSTITDFNVHFAGVKSSIDGHIEAACMRFGLKPSKFSDAKRHLLELSIDLYQHYALIRHYLLQIEEAKPAQVALVLRTAMRQAEENLSLVYKESVAQTEAELRHAIETYQQVKGRCERASAGYNQIQERLESVNVIAQSVERTIKDFEARVQGLTLSNSVAHGFSPEPFGASIARYSELLQGVDVRRASSEQLAKGYPCFDDAIAQLESQDAKVVADYNEWHTQALAEVALFSQNAKTLQEEMAVYERSTAFTALPGSEEIQFFTQTIETLKSDLSSITAEASQQALEKVTSRKRSFEANQTAINAVNVKGLRSVVSMVNEALVQEHQTKVKRVFDEQHTLPSSNWNSARDSMLDQLTALSQQVTVVVKDLESDKTLFDSDRAVKNLNERLHARIQELGETQRDIGAVNVPVIDFNDLKAQARWPNQLRHELDEVRQTLAVTKLEEGARRKREIEAVEKMWDEQLSKRQQEIARLKQRARAYEAAKAQKALEIVAREQAEAGRQQAEERRTQKEALDRDQYASTKQQCNELFTGFVEGWPKKVWEKYREGRDLVLEAENHFAHNRLTEALQRINAAHIAFIEAGTLLQQRQQQRQQKIAEQKRREAEAERKRQVEAVVVPLVSAPVTPVTPVTSVVAPATPVIGSLKHRPAPLVIPESGSPSITAPEASPSPSPKDQPAQEPGFFKRHWRTFAILGAIVLGAAFIVGTIFTLGALVPVTLGVVAGVGLAMGATGVGALAAGVAVFAVGAAVVAGGVTAAGIAAADYAASQVEVAEESAEEERQPLLVEESLPSEAALQTTTSSVRSSLKRMSEVEDGMPAAVAPATPVATMPVSTPPSSVSKQGLLSPTLEQSVIREVRDWIATQSWTVGKGVGTSAKMVCQRLLTDRSREDDRKAFDLLYEGYNAKITSCEELERRLLDVWEPKLTARVATV